MPELQKIPATATRTLMMSAISTLCVINGLHFSPYFDSMLFLIRPFVAPVVSGGMILFYFTMIFVAVMTFVLSGVPAALYERVWGQKESTATSLVIWLITAFVIAFPALQALVYLD